MKEKAFPSKEVDWQESQIQSRTVYQDESLGMDLRDYFASKAMQGELSAQNFVTGEHWANEIDLAQRAYLIADAMLKQREL